MPITIATWNINSVRLRIDQVTRYLAEEAPDVLCLQETKCPDDRFPLAAFRQAGYGHVEIFGQKGDHGVAIASRLPLRQVRRGAFCGKDDARHIAVTLDAPSGRPLSVHNFYIPAGGDVPDPGVNEKFAHKLAFLDEFDAYGREVRASGADAVLVGDLNVAPYEFDVWSHRQLLDVVSHTPVETGRLEAARRAGGWTDAVRHLTPEPEKVFTWWSYRSPDWEKADRGRRLDHVWVSDALVPVIRSAEIGKQARGWERPSDHAPVKVTLG